MFYIEIFIYYLFQIRRDMLLPLIDLTADKTAWRSLLTFLSRSEV